jgi:hypothetical protein
MLWADLMTLAYDNINRIGATPGTTFAHDMLCNELSKVSSALNATYSWIAVNRRTGYSHYINVNIDPTITVLMACGFVSKSVVK